MRIPEDMPKGMIWLAGQALPIVGDMREVILARLDPAVAIGDHGRAADSIISPWITGSGVGGGQAEVLTEGADDDRYWTGDVESRYANQFMLGQQIFKVTKPSAIDATQGVIPLGDAYNTSTGVTSMYISVGTDLRVYDPPTSETTTQNGRMLATTASLPGPPTHKGTMFDGAGTTPQFYIPCGAAGYTRLVPASGASANIAPATCAPVSFTVWDDKLVCVDVNRYVRISLDGQNWDAPTDRMRLPYGLTPRNIIVMDNRAGEPTVHVITDGDVWAHDANTNRLVQTSMYFPRHPDQGLGSVNWRGDAFVSVGVGVHNYTGPGGTISAVGLDRDYGLPSELRGKIVDMHEEYNGVYALVEGLESSSSETNNRWMDAGTYYDDPLYFGAGRAYSSLHVFTGAGWHMIWRSDDQSGFPTRVVVSQANNSYRLWWGYGTDCYYINLRREFHAPKQGFRSRIDRFRPESSITLGRFDNGMRGYMKLASHLIANVEYLPPNCYVDCYFATDLSPDAFHYLGRVEEAGANLFRFGVGAVTDWPDFSAGTPYQWVQFRYDFHGDPDDDYQTPVVDSFVFYSRKLPTVASKSWVITVPLNFPEDWNGIGRDEAMDFIDGLTNSSSFYPLVYRNRVFRVQVSQSQGSNSTGNDSQGNRMLNVVEVDDGTKLLANLRAQSGGTLT